MGVYNVYAAVFYPTQTSSVALGHVKLPSDTLLSTLHVLVGQFGHHIYCCIPYYSPCMIKIKRMECYKGRERFQESVKLPHLLTILHLKI